MKRLALLIMLLLVIPSATAVWDKSTEVIEVVDGDIQLLPSGMAVRVHEVWNEGVALTITQNGKIIGSGEALKSKPLVVSEAVQVAFLGVSNLQVKGLQGRIQTYQWVDGEFTGYHFPKTLNLKTLYDVFATVKNTGVKDARFTVELTQTGEYIRSADRYMDEFGNLNPRLIDAQRPFQQVDIVKDGTARVDYRRIAPLRRQPSGTNSLHRSGDVEFNLLFNDQIVDKLVIPDVQLTTTQSGYIEDIRMPATLVRDTPVEVEFDVVNAGDAFGGQQSDKFNIYMDRTDIIFRRSEREFKTLNLAVSPDLLRGDLTAYISSTWKARLHPFMEPGDYTVKFTFSRANKVFDEYSVPIKVLPGAMTVIESVKLPERVNAGGTIPVEVKVRNRGLGRDLTLVLSSPMMEKSQIHKMHLNAEEIKTAKFNVPATGVGQETLEATLYLDRIDEQGKNFDPYAKPIYKLGSKKSSLYVYVPGMEKTVETKPVVAPVSEPVKRQPIDVDYVPPVQAQPEIAKYEEFNATPILVVAAVLLILLIVIKVLFYYSGA